MARQSGMKGCFDKCQVKNNAIKCWAECKVARCQCMEYA